MNVWLVILTQESKIMILQIIFFVFTQHKASLKTLLVKTCLFTIHLFFFFNTTGLHSLDLNAKL